MGRDGLRVCIGAALLLAAAPAEAQREPVLKQIRLPHNYYYREMYLPQATSGPSGVAWSPDGREVVVAMQGSLWRHALGTPVAEQLTSGPGYDSQPDWSPDGRFVAYASYRDDALELRLLDVAARTSRPLTRGGAVNVEPRFTPDGRRLAFVSTQYEGRFHVFVMDLAPDGTPGAPLRITEDRDGGLPRYYYGRYDHYLSPTWSPDGRELILVSNRGRIWGTGGVWRMRAEPGAEMRPIWHEETTWKARPDWSPDGRRVAYASYLGRQWHQLWLMTADGGDPFALTYGEHDVTAPRFARDGRRIAYVSNEDGGTGAGTSLWIVDLPGGKRMREDLSERRYLGPVGRVRLRVVDATGRAMPARLSVTGPDGRSFAPDDAWRHADDAFDRGQRRFEYGYFHTPGESALTLPAGTYAVEAARGLEDRPSRRDVVVGAGSSESVTLALERLMDLPALGFWSGDLHVHMNYAGTYRNDSRRLIVQAQAEDVHVIENLIVNKEQRIPDVASFSGALDPASTADTLLFHGQEFHTSFWGHTGLLGLRSHLLLPDYAGYVNTAAAGLDPLNSTVADLAHAQGALFGYVHPFDSDPDPAQAEEALTNALPVDVALGKLDYYEVVGFSDHRATERVWHRLLNCGFRIPAGAGTDAMANYASLRGPVGLNRVYVEAGPLGAARGLDHEGWLAALKAGRTFATNGPLLQFTLDGREPGDEIALPHGRHTLEARVVLRSIVPVDHLEVVRNGRVEASIPLKGDGTSADATLRLPVAASGWYTLRAWSERARHPVLDVYPFGTTSPIHVSVLSALEARPRSRVAETHTLPVRSPEDARYFMAWIDRLIAAAGAHAGWNTPREKDEALATLRRAREVFEQRR